MSAAYRRFEILLPLRLNDGSAVPPELLADTFIQFVGILLAFVQPRAADFFTQFKETLKDRFQQIDLWIVFYPIQRL